jgi:hypothetical protein
LDFQAPQDHWEQLELLVQLVQLDLLDHLEIRDKQAVLVYLD